MGTITVYIPHQHPSPMLFSTCFLLLLLLPPHLLAFSPNMLPSFPLAFHPSLPSSALFFSSPCCSLWPFILTSFTPSLAFSFFFFSSPVSDFFPYLNVLSCFPSSFLSHSFFSLSSFFFFSLLCPSPLWPSSFSSTSFSLSCEVLFQLVLLFYFPPCCHMDGYHFAFSRFLFLFSFCLLVFLQLSLLFLFHNFPSSSSSPVSFFSYYDFTLFFASLFSSLTCPCIQQIDHRDQSELEMKGKTEENSHSDITELQKQENRQLDHTEKETDTLVSPSKSFTHLWTVVA